eukprot:833362-Amphidinium_carterae.1
MQKKCLPHTHKRLQMLSLRNTTQVTSCGTSIKACLHSYRIGWSWNQLSILALRLSVGLIGADLHPGITPLECSATSHGMVESCTSCPAARYWQNNLQPVKKLIDNKRGRCRMPSHTAQASTKYTRCHSEGNVDAAKLTRDTQWGKSARPFA